MKAPKPAIPSCAPRGTAWFGGPIKWFSITLRISTEDLVPDDVTKFMGCELLEQLGAGYVASALAAACWNFKRTSLASLFGKFDLCTIRT